MWFRLHFFKLDPNDFEYDNFKKKVFLSHFFYYDEKQGKLKTWWVGYILAIVLVFLIFNFAMLIAYVVFIIISDTLIERDWNKNKKRYITKINELKKKG